MYAMDESTVASSSTGVSNGNVISPSFSLTLPIENYHLLSKHLLFQSFPFCRRALGNV